MKRITFSSLFFSLFLTSYAYSQIGIPAEEWQADLKFLQTTVHSDYPFLFKKTTAEEFDDAVEQLYQSIPDLQEHEIVTGLARIVSSFKYGHTSLGMLHGPAQYHLLPLNLYQFNDGVFVEGIHNDYKNLLGAKVVKIDGVPLEKVLAAVRPVVPAENDQYFKAHGLSYVCSPEVLHAQGVTKELKNSIVLTVEKDGKTLDQEVAAVNARRFPFPYGFVKKGGNWESVRDQSETPLYLKNLDKIYYFEHLPDQKTVYVRHSQIQDEPDETIPAFYDRVFEFVKQNDVEKLVIDLRLNGGGNNYKNKPIVTGIIRTEKINQPGKLFVIIGRRTFSACQNLVNELDNYTNAIFVGEPTGENINFYGDNRVVKLPNSKIPVRLSFAWWQDKPQWENGDWTPPHLAVEMSFDEYRTNQDPVLETALKFSDANFVLDPMAHLTSLFQAQKLDELEAEAMRLVKDPRYKFVDFEVKINEVGYKLLNDGQVKEAMYVLHQNNKLFPDSANTWDSLGEAFWKAGDKEKAVEHYNKAIALDPSGDVGANAKQMLARMKAEQASAGK